MCRGLIYWPECSHTDTLMLDYMPANAWDPSNVKIDEFLPGFCDRRYMKYPDEMYEVWRKALPLAKLTGWSGPAGYVRVILLFLGYAFSSAE